MAHSNIHVYTELTRKKLKHIISKINVFYQIVCKSNVNYEKSVVAEFLKIVNFRILNSFVFKYTGLNPFYIFLFLDCIVLCLLLLHGNHFCSRTICVSKTWAKLHTLHSLFFGIPTAMVNAFPNNLDPSKQSPHFHCIKYLIGIFSV